MGDDATLLAGRLGLRDDALTDAAFTAEYPFAHRFAKIAGWNMHYFDTASDGSDGEPVVMVHGNPTWSYFYRTLAKRLAADGFRCLAMDHIGCGLSDKPQKYPYTLDRHIDNLDEWLAQALPGGEAFNLVVHDWGGPIGMGLALRHPERVRRVVVLNTSAFALGAMPRRITVCRVPWLGALLVRGLNAFAGGAAKMTTCPSLQQLGEPRRCAPFRAGHSAHGAGAFRRALRRHRRPPRLRARGKADAHPVGHARLVLHPLLPRPVEKSLPLRRSGRIRERGALSS